MLKTVVGDGGQHERQAWHGDAAMPAAGRQPPAGQAHTQAPAWHCSHPQCHPAEWRFLCPLQGSISFQTFIVKHLFQTRPSEVGGSAGGDSGSRLRGRSHISAHGNTHAPASTTRAPTTTTAMPLHTAATHPTARRQGWLSSCSPDQGCNCSRARGPALSTRTVRCDRPPASHCRRCWFPRCCY